MSTVATGRKMWKGIHVPFLLFLLMLTQSNMMLKPLAFVFVFFITPSVPLKINRNTMGVFYFLMIGYAAFSIFTLQGNTDNSYVLVYILGMAFWVLGFIAFQYIADFVKHNSIKSIDATLLAYFIINALVCFYQLIKLVVLFEGNPFLNQSAGDDVFGIFSNSSVNFIVCSFFVFYFFYTKRYKWAMVAGLLCLTATYMTGMVILSVVTAYLIFASPRFKLSQKVAVAIMGVLFVVVFSIISPANISYAEAIIRSAFTDNKPRKLISFIQTYEYATESPRNFMFGAGMGNFSSRIAFSAAGEFVAWYPRKYLHRSAEFTKNHYTLWNADLILEVFQQGTANQPFSVYNQMLGEYGIIGLIFLFVFYLRFFFRNYSRLTYGAVLFLLMLAYFTLDYWFEYLTVTVILELMALLDLKRFYEKVNQTPQQATAIPNK